MARCARFRDAELAAVPVSDADVQIIVC